MRFKEEGDQVISMALTEHEEEETSTDRGGIKTTRLGWAGRRAAATGSGSRQGAVSTGDAPPIVVVAKSAKLRFRLRRKLRLLPCSSSPHRAGRGGGPA